MERTEVVILGTLHRLHRDNKLYSYEDIFKIIDNYAPEVIGVEIREEDIGQSKEYLKKYYPYEMIEAKFRYEDKCRLYGFDWFEECIKGKLIPEGYFDDLEKVKLEKALESDERYARERRLLELIDNIRYELVLNHTADEVNDGKYDVIGKIYYGQFEILFENTPYKKLYEFYKARDEHIDSNIINIIKNNAGKKILLLMGLDHRIFAIESIKQSFSEYVVFTDILGK